MKFESEQAERQALDLPDFQKVLLWLAYTIKRTQLLDISLELSDHFELSLRGNGVEDGVNDGNVLLHSHRAWAMIKGLILIFPNIRPTF